MKHLGIDYGSKKIGLAISDESGSLAFPREVMMNDDGLVARLVDMVESEGVQAIVIGHSLTSSGVENPIMKGARSLTSVLEKKLALPIHFVNEMGSTAAVLASHDMLMGRRSDTASPGARKTKGQLLDAGAAAILLQRYLDNM